MGMTQEEYHFAVSGNMMPGENSVEDDDSARRYEVLQGLGDCPGFNLLFHEQLPKAPRLPLEDSKKTHSHQLICLNFNRYLLRWQHISGW